MKFIERINGYWLQEIAIQMEKDGKDGGKVLIDALPNASHGLIQKLLDNKALLKSNNLDGFEVEEN